MPTHCTVKKKTMVCKAVGGARAVDGKAQCLEDKMRGAPHSFFYYDHIHSIIRNTQLLYMLHCSYWLPNSDIPEIFHNMTTIAFHLNLY